MNDIVREGCSLEVLEWMKDNGFHYNERTFAYAAWNGNLENMKWLKDNGVPYDIWTKQKLIKLGLLKD